jgi:single-strand selective monofunctional uracil DNA glycosylase
MVAKACNLAMFLMLTHPLIEAAIDLRNSLSGLTFAAPVTHVYQPLDYAWRPHTMYLERYASKPKKVLFLGMNPGPYGMAQTGIPFGEIAAVRDWMGITAVVGQPTDPHPKRPIEGFACAKSEVSGRRLWGLFSQHFPCADDFFRDHFVANYCPLVWMSATGANITPDKLPAAEMQEVERACQIHLQRVIEHLRPSFLVGIGAYAEQRLRSAAPQFQGTITKILHPSPASPAANRDWAGTAQKQLVDAGIWPTSLIF